MLFIRALWDISSSIFERCTMPGEFKSIPLRPTIGIFDTLSSPDEVGFGNWRVVKNCSTRTTKNRRRGGGWRRFDADANIYNNQDLHDQLTSQQYFYDQYSQEIISGGDLAGYSYPYFAPSTLRPPYSVFPPISGPYCGYIGDYPSGLFNDCPIFYPSLGVPYSYKSGFISTSNLLAHWPLDSINGSGQAVDLQNGNNFTAFTTDVVPGKLGGAIRFNSAGDYLLQSDSVFQTGDIKFGVVAWVNMIATTGFDQHICGRWGSAGSRSYRLVITSGGQLRFDVSNNGTAIVSVTHTQVMSPGTWYLVFAWHDPVTNMLNIRVNSQATVQTAHATGVLAAGSALYFSVGYDEASANSTLNALVDELSFWKNGFPSTVEQEFIYSNGAGFQWPFDATEICNTGLPFYYLYSYFYTSCPLEYPAAVIPGYPYGQRFPIYNPEQMYSYDYCGTYPHGRQGCREAITLLDDITISSGRKLIAATMSRVYELNQSSGNWRILADGLGQEVYSSAQCTCNGTRGMSATMGSYFLYTNNVDYPMSYVVGEEAATCDLNALQPITDLVALGITRAGGVVTWKGFAFFFDITEAGIRNGGKVIWSDLEDPTSLIESDTSFAGSATIAVGETILNAAPLANWLMFYTDKRIVRVTLVGGEDVFNFETVYESDEGTDALAYKFSLINAGKMHIYLGKSDVYVFTQFDVSPQNVAWITKAAGMIFNGITEDDATYEPINEDACNLVTGGWNDITKEAWLSWPTGDNVCPNVTLRFNTKYDTADFIDHGFTAFRSWRPDERPTVGKWIEDLGVCPRGSKLDAGPKDGPACDAGDLVAPVLYLRNETENPDLPVSPNSLCSVLGNRTLDDFCEDCPTTAVFIMASASDFTLKQSEDLYFYREMFDPSGEPEGCGSGRYVIVEYDTVLQMGLERFKTDDEKLIKRVTVEATPLPDATPNELECEVGYGSQPNCIRWAGSQNRAFECQTALSVEQQAARGIRQDGRFDFAFWRRGVYLAARIRIGGVGGGGDLSCLYLMTKAWGQADNI